MKKAVVKTILVIFTLIIFTGSSCKRDKNQATICTSENTLFFPKDPLDRFFFKDSSYWIYKDSLTGQIDSIWVKEAKMAFVNMEKIDPFSKGKCFQGGGSTYYTASSPSYRITFSPQPSSLGTVYNDERFSINILQQNNIIYFTSLRGNSYENLDGKEYGLIDSISSMIVNGVTYNDILRKTNEFSIYPDLYYSSYYAKHIGMVKFVRNDKSVWELVRYKIKQ